MGTGDDTIDEKDEHSEVKQASKHSRYVLLTDLNRNSRMKIF